MTKKLIIVDDEQLYINSIIRLLTRADYFNDLEISTFNSVDEVLSDGKLEKIQIALIDLNMPEKSGLELISILLELKSSPYIIVITGQDSINRGVQLLNSGVYDYFLKSRDNTDLLIKIKHILTLIDKDQELLNLRENLTTNFLINSSHSYSMIKTKKLLNAAKESDFPVLILGESGTGKEVLADYIQSNGLLKNSPYIKINSAGIVPSLMESEMFGHEKGSFTGATSTKKGKFEMASGGTLFLDEIGDMPESLQVKLLRTLQDGSFQRVGSSETLKSNVRIISATNKEIVKEVEEGRFREDLYYRLNIIAIKLPPLRERKEDIPTLINIFLSKFNSKYGKSIGISPRVIKYLREQHFPGNIRELENIIASSFAMCQGKNIEFSDLPEAIMSEEEVEPHYSSSKDLKSRLESVEKNIIITTLEEFNNSKSRTAKELGISRRQLYYKLEKFKII